MESGGKRHVIGSLLLLLGVVTVLNPLYLDQMLPYPTRGDGWDLTGLYYAALSTVGFLFLSGGAYAVGRRDRLTAKQALGLAVLAVAMFVGFNYVWNRAIIDVLGVRGASHSELRYLINPLKYPGGETVFIESVVALLFPLGIAVSDRDRSGVLLVVGGIVTALVIDLLLSFPIGYAGVLGLVLLLVSSDLLDIPFLGALIAFIPFVFGLAYNDTLLPPLKDSAGRTND